ncbi:P1 family peptidase [Serratia ureilytica]
MPGLKVGVAQDSRVRTGATVILPDSPAIAAVDVRGGGPATRETDALGEDNLVQTVDALTFSGGSVYGLAAADGVATCWGNRVKATRCARRPACRSPRSCPPPACTIWPTAATKTGSSRRRIASWASMRSARPGWIFRSAPSAPAMAP